MQASHRGAGAFLTRVGNAYIKGLGSLVEFCRRHGPWVVGAALALTALSVYYTATHFAISTDTSQILSRDLPFQRLQDRLDAAFPQQKDTALVVIDGDNAGLTEDASRRLAAWLQDRPQDIKSVYVPGGGQFFRKNGLLFLGTDELWSLSNRLSQAQPLIAQLSQRPTLPELLSVLQKGLEQKAKGGPPLRELDTIFDQLSKTMASQEAGRFYQLPWGELITGQTSEEQRRHFIIVKPRMDYDQIQPARRALATIQAGIRALDLDPQHGVQVRITGSAALDNDQLGAISKGAGLATVLCIAMVLVLLIVGLRSTWLVFFTLVTLFMGLSWTAAFALLATGPLNLLSVAFAVLFIGLGVDFGIQFGMRYQEEHVEQRTHRQALRYTALGIGGPLTLAAVAAAASFYSFLPTSYSGIVDLGVISGTSMFIALFANVTVLPALLSCRPIRARRRRFLHPLPLWRIPIHRYGRVIIIGTLLLALGTIPLIMKVRFDFNPLHMQNPDSDAVKTFKFLLSHSKISPYRIDILEPDLRSANELARRLGRLDVVSRTITLSSFVPDKQQEKLDIMQQMAVIMPSFTLLPSRPPATGARDIRAALSGFQQSLGSFSAQYPADALAGPARTLSGDIEHFLEHFKDAPRQLTTLQSRVMDGLLTQLKDLQLALQASPVSLGTLPASLRERYIAPSGEARVEVMSTLDLNNNVNMRRFVERVRSIAPNVSGEPIMLTEGGDAVVQAFYEASLTSVVLITALLLLALRSLMDALMVLIPLGLAAMFTVAGMELFGISFNLGNIIALPLLIGLGVAFGIYVVLRWRSGVPVARLLQTSTPEAVLLSALTTMSSFGSLAVSGDVGMSTLGKTLTLTLATVLMSILILQPALLMLRAPSPKENEPPLLP